MAEVLYVNDASAVTPHTVLNTNLAESFGSFKSLVAYLFKKGNLEVDSNRATVVVLNKISRKVSGSRAVGLDALPYEDKALLIEYFFDHCNPIVVESEKLHDHQAVQHLNIAIDSVNELINDRISRVAVWCGVGSHGVDDVYTRENGTSSVPHDVIATMSSTLSSTANKSSETMNRLIRIKSLICKEIDFISLLSDSSPRHLSKLCHLIGHWSFPAPELSNDDLVYCAYLIITYALNLLREVTFNIPTANEFLCLIFMVRDTYRNGNPFHNFRHAVDVLQACFHFSIRLHCLPSFKQLEVDSKADETVYLSGLKRPERSTILAPLQQKEDVSPPLTPLETLGLLVAALGHDLGHPGVTNAFLIKYSSPCSLIFNERSILELFHASVFVNKVLKINWPSFLNATVDEADKLNIGTLITSSILATDMAEHFEYIERLTSFKYKRISKEPLNVRLISSLLIKCADISNVTRPLRVSSQWSMLLSREFDEINVLERVLSNQQVSKSELEINYESVPETVDEIIRASPGIANGQLFFIKTFAVSLFSNISELLPDLTFTYDIVKENRSIWTRFMK
ncbi:uncharacterized protein PRCAT00003802001 [Priceomyces carsonii]|uniref:uncharacterized protein n=1 Tax=Priceomyces carsonii TaxID=28549 RepID=UPI002ED93630|nr:unnamed protein product [Priceomyces carsonii]